MNLKWIFIIFISISCTDGVKNSRESEESTELDTTIWQAESIVIDHDTMDLNLNHLYYRISDSTTGQWSFKNNKIKNEVPEKSCLHYTVWSDTILFGVACSNFKFGGIEQCSRLDSNFLCSKYLRVFASENRQYYLKNSTVIFRRSPVPMNIVEKVHYIFELNPDTVLVLW